MARTDEASDGLTCKDTDEYRDTPLNLLRGTRQIISRAIHRIEDIEG